MGRVSKTDYASAGLILGLVILLAILALLGYPFATLVLPFVIGGALGYGLARLVTSARVPSWVSAAAVLSAAVALVWGSISMVLPFVNPELARALTGADTSAFGTTLGRLAFGFGLVYLEQTFLRVSFPTLYPQTAEEHDRQSREWVRGTLIVGGIFLGLAVLGGIVFGGLALLSYLVAVFSG